MVGTPGWFLRVGRMVAAGGLAGVLSGGGGPAAAGEGAASCPAPAGGVSIQVQPFDSGLKYDVEHSETEMLAISTRKLPANMHVRGLTVEHMKSWIEVKVLSHQLGNGWCLMPQEIVAHVGFQDMTVYIDRKYPKGSCQRKAIAYHENKHVTINYEEMNAGLAVIERDLRAAFQSNRFPIQVADVSAGERYLEDYFSFALRQDVQRIAGRMEVRNINLDNPQEYASITALCPVW